MSAIIRENMEGGVLMIKETPPNIAELTRNANNQNSWRERLEAVNERKKYDWQQPRDILTRLAMQEDGFSV